jgi:hypothetical protein
MSIPAELIEDRVNKNMLFPLLPKADGVTIYRALLVAEQLHQELESPVGDDAWEKRIGELRADLEVFVGQPEIQPTYLFCLSPISAGTWEIRSTRPEPQIRVLALFADKDVLIATNHARRDDLGTKWDSREWRDAKRTARAIWNWLFHTFTPLVTADVKELVSGAIDGKYFREPRKA